MSLPDKSRRSTFSQTAAGAGLTLGKFRFVGYGEEMIQKTVRQSGRSGRVYLPPEWVGKSVKIIRLD